MGQRIDVYPESSQRALDAGRVGEVVSLGSQCFDATVCLSEDGVHMQYTPAVPSMRKRAGRRSVRNLEPGACTYVVRTRDGWRFQVECMRDSTATLDRRSMRVPLSVPNCATWEWCTKPTLGHAADSDWLPYADDHVVALEAAWQRVHVNGNSEAVTLELGSVVRIVDVVATTSMVVQYNSDRTKRRPVRRRIAMANECEERRCTLLERATRMDDACAICTERFEETPSLIARPCCPNGHCFHDTCMSVVRERGGACPMCRSQLLQP
jgi:hypothetical protein